MSQETSQWLNTMTLIGFTDKRGHAWHYRESDQGAEPNHYPQAVPVADVRRRLFNWEPAEGTFESTVIIGGEPVHITDPTRKTIVQPVTLDILGNFKSGFQAHEYGQWLLKNAEVITDSDESDGLGVSSAGLLKKGAVGWVQYEVPESVTGPEGIEFRPYLLAATSLDGSLSSTYQSGASLVVCDNTLSAALGSQRQHQVKVKHSRNSLGKIADVRQALGIIYSTADAMSAELAELTSTTVSDAQWNEFLAAHLGERPEGKGRSQTMHDSHRDTLNRLYRHDNRVAPWAGTAFGVVQAVNTYEHHEKNVKGASRAERNATKTVTGEFDKIDATTLTQLNAVLAA